MHTQTGRNGSVNGGRRVAVTGMGLLCSLGSSVEQCWSRLSKGESGIGRVDVLPVEGSRIKFGGQFSELELLQDEFHRHDLTKVDRGAKLAVFAALEAARSACLNLEDDRDPQFVPLVLGTTTAGMNSGMKYHSLLHHERKRRVSLLKDFLAYDHLRDVQRVLNIHGPAIAVSTACASGATAIGHAFRWIRSGTHDLAIAGGYDPLCPFTWFGFESLQALTREKCRPFDENRSGFVLGEGAGFLILENLDTAKNRGATVLAEVAGFGETNEGFHMTRPHPDGLGIVGAMQAAIGDAGIRPVDVGYLNAHGTGTKANDAAESNAIREVFGDHLPDLRVSSTKAAIGHTMGGAGAIEAIFCILAIAGKVVPPNLNLDQQAQECSLRLVTQPETVDDLSCAMSNSIGFGGSNASLLFIESKQ